MSVTWGHVVLLNGMYYEGHRPEPVYETRKALHSVYDERSGSADRLLLWGIYIHFLGA